MRFARDGLISRQLVGPLSLLTIVSSALGAALAVKLPEAVVKAVVGISMALLVVFMAARRSSTSRSESIPPPHLLLGYVLGGLFSGGYTTLMTVLGVSCFGLRMLESVALMKPINLVSCAAACVVFLRSR